MKKFLSLLVALVLVLPGYSGAESLPKEDLPKADLVFFQKAMNLIKEKYPYDLSQEDLVIAGVKGMMQSIDPYSDYYTLEEAQAFTQSLDGELVGIGVLMELVEGKIRIGQVFPGYPAAEAGMKPGDILVAVDGASILGKNLNQVSSLIKGEKDSFLTVRVKRGDRFLDLKMQRREIELNPVSQELLEGKIGYIKISEFTENMTRHLGEALEDLDRKQVTKLVIDLRDNPGGYLNQALEMAEFFIPRGDVVHIRYRDQEVSKKSQLDKQKYQLVVLINGNSASASEIFAGAVQDRQAGKIVGRTSFGKGRVQELYPVNDGSLIKITTAEYLRPSRQKVDGVGIVPDYEVDNLNGEDLQLKKALDLLR